MTDLRQQLDECEHEYANLVSELHVAKQRIADLEFALRELQAVYTSSGHIQEICESLLITPVQP